MHARKSRVLPVEREIKQEPFVCAWWNVKILTMNTIYCQSQQDHELENLVKSHSFSSEIIEANHHKHTQVSVMATSIATSQQRPTDIERMYVHTKGASRSRLEPSADAVKMVGMTARAPCCDHSIETSTANSETRSVDHIIRRTSCNAGSVPAVHSCAY